jgi:hypothetical protein
MIKWEIVYGRPAGIAAASYIRSIAWPRVAGQSVSSPKRLKPLLYPVTLAFTRMKLSEFKPTVVSSFISTEREGSFGRGTNVVSGFNAAHPVESATSTLTAPARSRESQRHLFSG